MPMEGEDKGEEFCDWKEEVESKSSLRWYKLVKDDETEMYIRSLQRYQRVRLMIRLRIEPAGLFQDKMRCRIFSDDRCVTVEKLKVLTIS